MVSFNKFFKSVFLAVALASTTLAVPFPTSSKHATHRVRTIRPGFKLETFHPESTYETFGAGVDHPLSKRADSSLEDAAIAFVESRLGVDAKSISFKSAHAGEVASTVYVRQSHSGVPFANAVANVAFNNDNKVVSFGSSFVKPKTLPASEPSISLADAITTAESALGGKYNEHPATIEYVVQQDGSAALTHVVQIQNEETGAWFEAFVDAHSNELRSVTDFVTKASYLILPITKQSLDEETETLIDPQNLASSPDGWHNDGKTNTTTTSGNNAIAYVGSQSNTTRQSSEGLNFIYKQDPSQGPKVGANIDAARTNAFYIVNTIHDITYQYGFTEAAFNFQNNNFGKGGKGNDRVTVSVQDSASKNNADFSTPPDGQSGAMRMFLWTQTNPQRDGALENDIISHENTHGLTNRMTGGGTGRCLQTTEAGGMGEGWSDAFAEWAEQKNETISDFSLGRYVLGDTPAGIRTHPYSTDPKVNPLRYSSVKALNEVHNIGEVWANLLHNVYAALVGAHGFSATAHTDATGTEGNVVFLHLFIDALALQPCNPTFLSARDAWIQADVNRYNGANKCLLWNAFASRGVGLNAKNFIDDSTVPVDCKA